MVKTVPNAQNARKVPLNECPQRPGSTGAALYPIAPRVCSHQINRVCSGDGPGQPGSVAYHINSCGEAVPLERPGSTGADGLLQKLLKRFVKWKKLVGNLQQNNKFVDDSQMCGSA